MSSHELYSAILIDALVCDKCNDNLTHPFALPKTSSFFLTFASSIY